MAIENAVVLSPDIGNVKRARAYAERLNLPLAIVDKRRTGPNEAEVMNVIGDINGKNVLVFDDMIDTGGTLCNGIKAIAARGARDIYACATHAVFSGPARQRLQGRAGEEGHRPPTRSRRKTATALTKLEVVSVAGLFADAIKRVHEKLSVSALFD